VGTKQNYVTIGECCRHVVLVCHPTSVVVGVLVIVCDQAKNFEKNNIDPALEDDFRSRDVLRDGDLRSRGTAQNYVETDYVSCTSDPHRIAAPPPLHKKSRSLVLRVPSARHWNQCCRARNEFRERLQTTRLRFDFCDDLGNF
jgi:hypothetical protein